MATVIPKRAPNFAWVGRIFTCSGCGGSVELELSDMGGITKLRPKLISGLWECRAMCPYCKQNVLFREQEDMDGAAPSAGEDRPSGQPEAKLRGDADGEWGPNPHPFSTPEAAGAMPSGWNRDTLASGVPAREG